MWYILRHGQTDLNVQERMQGALDYSLNPVGFLQVQSLGRHLSDVVFDVAYRSPALRCDQTTQEVLARNVVGFPVVVDDRLREQSKGAWEGLTGAAIRAKYPVAYSRFLRGDDGGVPGGEPLSAVIDRVGSFVDDRLGSSSGNVLVVAHGGSNRALLAYLDKLSAATAYGVSQREACLNIIDPFGSYRSIDNVVYDSGDVQ